MENHQQVPPKATKHSISAGVKLTAIICIILFFFPLCTVSCSFDGEVYTEKLSGWECATGTEVFEGDGTVEAHPVNFILLLIPIALLTFAFVCRSKISPVALVLGLAQIIALLIFRNSVIEYVEAEGRGMLDLSFTSWYTLDLISASISALLGLFSMITSNSLAGLRQNTCENNQ